MLFFAYQDNLQLLEMGLRQLRDGRDSMSLAIPKYYSTGFSDFGRTKERMVERPEIGRRLLIRHLYRFSISCKIEEVVIQVSIVAYPSASQGSIERDKGLFC